MISFTDNLPFQYTYYDFNYGHLFSQLEIAVSNSLPLQLKSSLKRGIKSLPSQGLYRLRGSTVFEDRKSL